MRKKLTKRQIDVFQTLVFMLPFVALWAVFVVMFQNDIFERWGHGATVMLGVIAFALGAVAGRLDVYIRDYNDNYELN